MQYISFLIFKFIVWIFSNIPFKLLYKMSDAIAYLLANVFKYRRKVVEENLDMVKNTFNHDREKLIRDIYRNVSEVLLEGIKGFSMKPEELKKRHRFTNPELVDELYRNRQSFLLASGHYTNWEWGAFSPNFFVNHLVIALYKPLSNPYIEEYMLNKRSIYGSILADINKTEKYFETYVNQTSVFLMAADQSPTKPERALWYDFLGVPTPFIHGVEKYSNQYDLPVVFAQILRVSRGHYEIQMSWIREQHETLEPGQITYRYVKYLERDILNAPANWLWTHRKWKHHKRFEGRLDWTDTQEKSATMTSTDPN